jgi:hypothetical protein
MFECSMKIRVNCGKPAKCAPILANQIHISRLTIKANEGLALRCWSTPFFGNVHLAAKVFAPTTPTFFPFLLTNCPSVPEASVLQALQYETLSHLISG